MKNGRRIHIMGASGTGATTLARSLGDHLGVPHFDTDQFYWVQWPPDFSNPAARRPRDQVLTMMKGALSSAPAWTLSGSLDGWGDSLIPSFDVVVFLTLETKTRIARIKAREEALYEDTIRTGGSRHESFQQFLRFAESYDSGGGAGRSRERHENWLRSLPPSIQIIRLDTRAPPQKVLDRAVSALKALSEPLPA